MVLEQSEPEQHHLPVFKSLPDSYPSVEAPKRIPPVSPLRPLHAPNDPTPVTARHRNLQWVTSITTGKFIEGEAMQVQRLYEKYARKDYSIYKSAALLSITNAIVEFTPDCMDVPKRQRSIYHFFEHFINRIAENHLETEMAVILGVDTNLNSILCLACNLFNYAYQSQLAAYRNYCRLFGVTLL